MGLVSLARNTKLLPSVATKSHGEAVESNQARPAQTPSQLSQSSLGDLPDDIILEMLCVCEVADLLALEVTCRRFAGLAADCTVRRYHAVRLHMEGVVDIPPNVDIMSLNAVSLRELIVKSVQGPQSLRPRLDGDSSTVLTQPDFEDFHVRATDGALRNKSIDIEPGNIKLIAGGRFITFYRHVTHILECWDVRTNKVVFEWPIVTDSEGDNGLVFSDYDVEVIDSGRAIVLATSVIRSETWTVRNGTVRLRVIRLDLETFLPTELFDHVTPLPVTLLYPYHLPHWLRISGGILGMRFTIDDRPLLLVNWLNASTAVISKDDKWHPLDATLFAGSVAVISRVFRKGVPTKRYQLFVIPIDSLSLESAGLAQHFSLSDFKHCRTLKLPRIPKRLTFSSTRISAFRSPLASGKFTINIFLRLNIRRGGEGCNNRVLKFYRASLHTPLHTSPTGPRPSLKLIQSGSINYPGFIMSNEPSYMGGVITVDGERVFRLLLPQRTPSSELMEYTIPAPARFQYTNHVYLSPFGGTFAFLYSDHPATIIIRFLR